jgi:hypothetical protein
MALNLWLSRLLRPETMRDKWLRAVITGVGAALALVIAIILFASGGDDDNGAQNDRTVFDMLSPATSNWESVTGHVTEVRQDDIRDNEGTVTATFWFVKYEYYIGEDYYIRDAQVASAYAVGDAVKVYYSPDDNGTSTLFEPGTENPVPAATGSSSADESGDDDGGGSSAGAIILLFVGGLLSALTIVQIVDLRRDAMGPDA